MSAPTDEITTREACELLNVHRATIARYVANGRLTPSRKLGAETGAYMFWRADIARLATEVPT
jgi:excisionase family DNA binding protein